MEYSVNWSFCHFAVACNWAFCMRIYIKSCCNFDVIEKYCEICMRICINSCWKLRICINSCCKFDITESDCLSGSRFGAEPCTFMITLRWSFGLNLRFYIQMMKNCQANKPECPYPYRGNASAGSSTCHGVGRRTRPVTMCVPDYHRGAARMWRVGGHPVIPVPVSCETSRDRGLYCMQWVVRYVISVVNFFVGCGCYSHSTVRPLWAVTACPFSFFLNSRGLWVVTVTVQWSLCGLLRHARFHFFLNSRGLWVVTVTVQWSLCELYGMPVFIFFEL